MGCCSSTPATEKVDIKDIGERTEISKADKLKVANARVEGGFGCECCWWCWFCWLYWCCCPC